MRIASSRLALALLAGLVLPLLAHGAESQGQRLSDFLDTLNEHGRSIIYSSDLVTDEMLVSRDLQATLTEQELRDLLRAFGLTATVGPGDSLLVVRASRRAGTESSGHGDPDATRIPEIIVTSSLHRLDNARPATHNYLDRELLARIPKTADEAVRLTHRLPGTASGGVSTKTHVRGGETDEVLFLFDGLRLYEPYHLKDFQAIATIINATAIGGMDLYTGAYPARFGDRMSAVLSMDLRTPERPAETELAVSFFNASALSLGTFGEDDRGDWLVSARRGNLDLVVDVIDSEFGSPDYQDYLAHVGWAFGPRLQLSANALFSDDKLSLVDASRGEYAFATYTNQVGWLKWRADWTDTLTSDTILAASDITDRRAGSLDLPGIVSGNLDELREFSALELRQDWQWVAAEHWMLRFGFNIKDLDAVYQFTSSQSIAPPFDAILDNQPVTVRDYDLDPSGAQYAAYTELRWRPIDQWTFDFGVRWDLQTYTTAENDRQYSPRISALYQPGEKTEIRIGWGQYYQAEEINELQVSDGVTDFSPAQQAEHVVLNLQLEVWPGIDASISAYRNSYRRLRPRFENSFNTLTLLPELQFDRVMLNPSGAEAIGAEALLTGGSSDEPLIWWLSYTWSQIRDEEPTGEVARSWDQTHTVKGGLSWRWGQWDFSATGEVHSGWPKTAMTGSLVPDINGVGQLVLDVAERNSTRHSAFHALDVRVSREIELSRGDLTAYLDVTNIYDRANPCCVEFSVNADGSLASRDRHWLPLVPSLGVIWRF